MKKLLVCLVTLLCSGVAFSQINLTLDISGGKSYGGKIYISLFNSERSYEQRQVYRSLVLDQDTETVSVNLSLPAGEYLFSIYQDNNNNGELDTNLLGLPKELFGFSNYDGKSVPGSFKKHKIQVNETTQKIKIYLYNIKVR